MEVNVKSAEWATYKQNWRNQVMPVLLPGLVSRLYRSGQLHRLLCRHGRLQGQRHLLFSKKWDKMFERRQKNPDEEARAKMYSQDPGRCGPMRFPPHPFSRAACTSLPRKGIKGIKISPTLQFIYAPIEAKTNLTQRVPESFKERDSTLYCQAVSPFGKHFLKNAFLRYIIARTLLTIPMLFILLTIVLCRHTHHARRSGFGHAGGPRPRQGDRSKKRGTGAQQAA
jgi:hypothetical protein